MRVGSGTPYVSGLTPNGRLLVLERQAAEGLLDAARRLGAGNRCRRLRGAVVADEYPWRAQGSKTTYSTSAVLDLTPGKWFYRVRGLNLVADPQAADDLVDARQAHGLEAELPHREQLAEGDKVGAR